MVVYASNVMMVMVVYASGPDARGALITVMVVLVYASSVMMMIVVYTAPLPAVGRPHTTSSMVLPEAVHHKLLGYYDVLGNEAISRQGLAAATAAATAAGAAASKP
jgi:hypothetical protein